MREMIGSMLKDRVNQVSESLTKEVVLNYYMMMYHVSTPIIDQKSLQYELAELCLMLSMHTMQNGTHDSWEYGLLATYLNPEIQPKQSYDLARFYNNNDFGSIELTYRVSVANFQRWKTRVDIYKSLNKAGF